MEEKKDYSKTILIGILILLVLISLFNWYGRRGWEDDFVCTLWVPYSTEDRDNMFKCKLSQCQNLKNKENTKVQSCICELNKKEVWKVCVEGFDIRRYTYLEKENREEENVKKGVVIPNTVPVDVVNSS